MDQVQTTGAPTTGAPTSAPGIANADAATRAKRQEFYDRLTPNSMAPLWEVLGNVVTPEPRVTSKPHLWKWDVSRKLLLEAGALLTAEEAERRVLVLENPAYPGESRATNTLYAGIQLVMPGEVAPAHRHTQSALRFVLESKGGYTAVAGEKTTMMPGDFVITPSWTFHDHGNTTDQPIIWMDVLDVPMLTFFEGGFSEHHNDKTQSLGRPEGDALARYGSGLLPIDLGPEYGLNTPVFNYPYVRTREALLTAAQGAPLDPHWGMTMRYVNPVTGGWTMPTIASWMMFLPAGARTKPMRSTDGLICAVAEGTGVIQAGSTKMNFAPKDSFVIPNWTWRHFEAHEDTFLFFSSDRGVQERMGIWREQRED
jgi:gentisate 1,2-dioxygenase